MFILFKLVFTFHTELLHSVLDFCYRHSISLKLEGKNCYLCVCLSYNSTEALMKLIVLLESPTCCCFFLVAHFVPLTIQ